MDPNKMAQEDFDMLMGEEFGDQFITKYPEPQPRKPYSNEFTRGMGFSVPEEYINDYKKELDYIKNDQGNDPLLMFILQKNAQNGTLDAIGSDSYYYDYDPEMDPDLGEEYQDFLDQFYLNR